MSGKINRVGVVGLGVMGFDIAFLYAMKGFQTHAYDAAKAAMESLHGRLEQTVERLKRRNRISEEEIANLRGLFTPSVDLAGLAHADLITEAVSENPQIKSAVYRALGNAGFSGILTTNTSAITREKLRAEGAYDGRKFALTHFFNPVLHTRMVEVVEGNMDHAEGAAILDFLRQLGRDPIETRDISGYVSNGILMNYAVMALRLLERGARIEQVDQAAQELKLLPPFVSFDSWKPSIVEDVTRVMFELGGDTFLRSSQLLARLGKNNPRFYVDGKPNPKVYELADASGRTLDDTSVKRALWTSLFCAAARVAELGESPAVVDLVATDGIKMPQAPLREIDARGAATLLRELDSTNRTLSNEPFPAPRLLTAMVEERQTFYKHAQPNPWLKSRAGH